MEKIALLELNPNYVKMNLVEVEKNKNFVIRDIVSMPIDLMKNFEPENFIRPAVIKEILDILTVFKKMLDRENIIDTICFANSVLADAKNCNGLLNEIANASTFKFEILEAEAEINKVYMATINTFNKPKALLINVSEYSTQLMVYNRRNIMGQFVIPYGKINLYNAIENSDSEEKCNEMKKFINKELDKMDLDISNLPEDWEIIGSGSLFRALGVLSRRAKKYPVDIEHNYEMTKEDFQKVYQVVKPLEANKTNKLKGLTNYESMYFSAGLTIVDAILDRVPNKDTFAISKTDKEEGILFNYALPLTLDKPISDTMGYSLSMLVDSYDRPDNIKHVYEIALMLFAQFKVIHKLGRFYIRILKIATQLRNCGYRVGCKDHEKFSFDVILNSDIYGASHTEIVLAAFVSKLRDLDNFNLSDWIRYKEIIGDIDIETIRRLAVIIKIAESLDITKFGVVKDIECDILGDSVILKLITCGDASLEIKHANNCGIDFKKTYNKKLQIM